MPKCTTTDVTNPLKILGGGGGGGGMPSTPIRFFAIVPAALK